MEPAAADKHPAHMGTVCLPAMPVPALQARPQAEHRHTRKQSPPELPAPETGIFAPIQNVHPIMRWRMIEKLSGVKLLKFS